VFTVLECVVFQHDRVTVGLAATILLLTALALFALLIRGEECDARRRNSWRAVAACVGGLGIWATHFVAMLAYHGIVTVAFDPSLTALSAVIVVAGFWMALRTLEGFGLVRCLAAAGLATAAIAVMHFVGMGAVRAAARIHYDIGFIAGGIAVAAVLLSVAFLSFERLKGGWPRVVAPAILALLSVCALHFAGMSATRLIPDPSLPVVVAQGLGRVWLIGAVSVVACGLTAVTMAAVLIDRYLTDLKGFAEATLEGVAVVRDGRIVEVNLRFAELMGTSEAALTGTEPDACLVTADGLPADAPRDLPIEAAPRSGDEGQVFELAVHTIEYRGRPSQVLALKDLTEQKAAQRQIEHLAGHDALTDLPNRTLFQDRFDHAIARASRSGESIAILALDLDRFKAVNDLFGHAEGDRVLKAVAGMLRRCVRNVDTVARIGGDEFMILQVGSNQPDGARLLSERIVEVFRDEMNTALDPTAVGISIGVALFPDDAQAGEALRHAADIALYRAKSAGRGRAAFYDLEMDREVRERRELETDLRHAIARGQMRLAYQPLVTAADSVCGGYEALLRWSHPDRGEVEPDTFIPIAEETGSIIALGEWVLRQACSAAASWDPGLSVAVNVSPVQFRLANLADRVTAILAETGLAPERLQLEITETALMKDRAVTLETLHRLRHAGVRVVMDDFGTGYSSLSNLQSFPFDKIKIDRCFISAMEEDGSARAIVRAIVGLGRSLHLPVVAEGVETPEQHRMVVEEGCAEAQGFLFGRPGAGPAAVLSRAGAISCSA
jgi:diguanylate cyclase (GGDEF)-like protein